MLSALPHTELSDTELLDRFRSSGDNHWLGLLFGRYLELTYGVCLKYLRQEADAEDAVMGIFEELVKKVPEHDIREFRPWLYVLARNYCLMELRRRGRHPKREWEAGLVHSELVEHPVFEARENGRFEQLEHCLEQLGLPQQTCIRLFYLEGKSYKEIARLQNEALGRVRSHIQNGRRNLRNCMERDQDDA
jgi:RNA polymerase sigma-70 factor (ECF subfamily)